MPVFQCDKDQIIKTDAAGLFDPRCADDDGDQLDLNKSLHFISLGLKMVTAIHLSKTVVHP